MTLPAGRKLGPYEVAGPLGAGGMGEVYRARDTRLGREVAIKILPRQSMEDPEARQRFEREARAISSLNHPHVCTLYDVGHDDGTDFLVMELLEGETLAKRLEKGPIDTADLLRIAIDVADALDKAHRHGILHRDLKPLNVMLTRTGAKLMDFGLAKAMGPPLPGSPLLQSLNPPTRTTPLTAQGTLVGTFQYMAPEQLEGNDADVRSDIFSFGAVLYEMAVGRRAFEGKTTASVIAAVLERDPPSISSVRPMSPPALERTVKACLAKDPDARLQSAHDVKLQLEWVRDSNAAGTAPVVGGGRSHREMVGWTATGLLAAIVAGLAYGQVTRTPTAAPAVIAQIAPPPHAAFALWGVAPGMPALSPDGTELAFVAQTTDGKQSVWVRPLASPGARLIDGTEDAQHPFWSPDGRSIGYFHRGELYRVDISGGPPVAVATVGPASMGTWSSAGVILVVGSQTRPGGTTISRVPAAGGSPLVIEKPGTKWSNLSFPQFLPDGEHFLFYARSSSSESTGTYAASLKGEEAQAVLHSGSPALYAKPGYLLFLRNRTLMAQPFDARTLRISGDALPLVDDAALNGITGEPILAASDTGTLVFDTVRTTSDRIVWYDGTGTSIATTGSAGEWGTPSLSPDGRRLAVSYSDSTNGSKPDVWVYDLARNVKTRVTSAPGINADAFWSSDNQHVSFTSNRSGSFRLYQKAADGTGAATPLVGSEDPTAAEFFGSWSTDGRYLAFQRTVGARIQSNGGPANGEIWGLASGNPNPFPVVQNGQFVAIQPALSAEGKWLAYVSDESGQLEVYVVPFPRGPGKYLVSSGGGAWPRWSRDGKTLWYRQGGRIMSVEMLATAGSLTIGRTQALFPADPAPGGLGPMYDVSADGKKFVIVSRSEAEAAKPLTLVLNWPALLTRH